MSNAQKALQVGREQAFQQMLDFLGHESVGSISVEELIGRMPGVAVVLGVTIEAGNVVQTHPHLLGDTVLRLIRLELSPDAYQEIRTKLQAMPEERDRVGKVDRFMQGPERIDLDGILLAREGDRVG